MLYPYIAQVSNKLVRVVFPVLQSYFEGFWTLMKR